MKTAVKSPFAWLTRSRGRVASIVPRLGLCLSSGGARGLAHVGVIQVLEEEGIPISAVAGSSMGAYVGSLWAAGFNGTQLESLAREIRDRRALFRLLDPLFPPSAGLIRGEKIRRHLERSLGSMTFAEMKKPLLVVATDLDSLEPKVFDRGPVAEAVHASAAIPGVCAPVPLHGRRYTDGGASEPLPVDLLRRRLGVDHVLAVNVVPTPEDLVRCNAADPRQPGWNPLRWVNLLAYGNVLDTFHRSLMAAQMQVAAKEARHADVLMHPVFCEAHWYDFENFDRYIKAGRDAAIAALPRIRVLMNGHPATKGGSHENQPTRSTMGLVAA